MEGLDTIVQNFAGLGVAGVIAGVLFKTFLEEKREEKQYFREEISASRELYKEELAKDRECYITSIEKITNRIDIIEDDVKEIKNTLEK